jgi:hypothetical protein
MQLPRHRRQAGQSAKMRRTRDDDRARRELLEQFLPDQVRARAEAAPCGERPKYSESEAEYVLVGNRAEHGRTPDRRSP